MPNDMLRASECDNRAQRCGVAFLHRNASRPTAYFHLPPTDARNSIPRRPPD